MYLLRCPSRVPSDNTRSHTASSSNPSSFIHHHLNRRSLSCPMSQRSVLRAETTHRAGRGAAMLSKFESKSARVKGSPLPPPQPGRREPHSHPNEITLELQGPPLAPALGTASRLAQPNHGLPRHVPCWSRPAGCLNRLGTAGSGLAGVWLVCSSAKLADRQWHGRAVTDTQSKRFPTLRSSPARIGQPVGRLRRTPG